MKNRQLNFRDERSDVDAHLEFVKNNPHPISLLLDGVINQRNLASIFRIAEAGRLKTIYGYSIPDLNENIKFRRISRNTFEALPFQILQTVEEVKVIAKNKVLTALEITTQSIPYTAYTPEKECILVIGSEKKGVSPEILELCTTSIHIPMYGLNTSMNVAVATGIAVFELLRKINS